METRNHQHPVVRDNGVLFDDTSLCLGQDDRSAQLRVSSSSRSVYFPSGISQATGSLSTTPLLTASHPQRMSQHQSMLCYTFSNQRTVCIVTSFPSTNPTPNWRQGSEHQRGKLHHPCFSHACVASSSISEIDDSIAS